MLLVVFLELRRIEVRRADIPVELWILANWRAWLVLGWRRDGIEGITYLVGSYSKYAGT